MGTKLIKADEPSIQSSKVMILPREEAYRLRRAARQAFDQYLPRGLEIVAEMAMDEDPENRKWAADKIFKYAMTNKSNEELDPEMATVDGSVASKDALKQLEEMTEDGTGALDPDEK